MPFLPALRRWLADGRLYALLSAAGFSLKAIFVKLAYAAGAGGALTLLSLRMALALPLFLWLLYLSRGTTQTALSRGDKLRILLLGTLGYYLSSLFDFYGLETISAGLERMILYAYPCLVLLFHAALTRQRPSLRAVTAMLICYAGLGVAFFHDVSFAGASHAVLTGSAWVFASAVSYALYYVGTGQLLPRVGSMRLAGLAGSVAAVLVLSHYGLTQDWAPLFRLPGAVWAYAALMAVLSTALPIYWGALAIQRMGAAHAATFGNLGPVLTLIAAWLILGEAISAWQILGLALVLFGVTHLKPGKAVKQA